MPNLVNKLLSRDLDRAVKDSDSMILISLGGLSVSESEELRSSLAEGGARLHMVRNTLIKLVFEQNGIDVPTDVLKGNTAVVFGQPEHAIHAAKVVHDSEPRKEGRIEVKAGRLEGRVLGAESARALANLPDKDSLRAMFLSCLSAPARNLVGVLAAPPGALARVIQAHADADGGSEG